MMTEHLQFNVKVSVGLLIIQRFSVSMMTLELWDKCVSTMPCPSDYGMSVIYTY